MYTYFLILNDYGIRPSTVWGMAILKNRFPHPDDLYKADEAEWKPCAEYGYTDARYSGRWCRYGNSNMFPPPKCVDET